MAGSGASGRLDRLHYEHVGQNECIKVGKDAPLSRPSYSPGSDAVSIMLQQPPNGLLLPPVPVAALISRKLTTVTCC